MTRRLDADDACPLRDGFSMPPEWAPHARTWMCWPCRIEAFGSPEALLRAKQAFARVARAISSFEPVTMAVRPADAAEVKLATGGKVDVLEIALDDSWSRDFGPTFLSSAEGGIAAVAWQFNAWGNKYRPWEDDAAFAGRVAEHTRVKLYRAPLVCEGGAIHTNGAGVLLSTEQCLLAENRNPHLSQQQIEERLALFTGARRILWLGTGFSDEETDGHIDNIACFASPNRIVVGMPASRSHPDYEPVMDALHRLREARDPYGLAFEIIELVQPQKARLDWRGRPLQTSYVNFYLTNGGVVMPAFDDRNDESARTTLGACFPGRDILQIDALDIVEGGGGIHCITQQEPESM